MYKIKLMSKTIKRNTNPNNSSTYMRIAEITAQDIGEYTSDCIPSVGDVICFFDGNYYDVVQIIHDIQKDPSSGILSESTIYVEVKTHSNKHLIQHGSLSFFEEIPLITEIEKASDPYDIWGHLKWDDIDE